MAVRLFFCTLALWLGAPAHSAAGPQVSVKLVTMHSPVSRAQDFLVGFHFKIAKGWHIYWKNPGQSGLPVRVEWEIPPGYRAGPLQWPYPQRIQVNRLINFGYEEDVLIPVSISSPNRIFGDSVVLNAKVKWLACRDECVPGRADARLELKTVPKTATRSADASLFDRAQKQLPQPLPKDWKAQVTLDKKAFVVSFATCPSALTKQIQFFPNAGNTVDEGAFPIFEKTAGACRWSIPSSEQTKAPPTTLDGLIVAKGKAYDVSWPVTSN